MTCTRVLFDNKYLEYADYKIEDALSTIKVHQGGTSHVVPEDFTHSDIMMFNQFNSTTGFDLLHAINPIYPGNLEQDLELMSHFDSISINGTGQLEERIHFVHEQNNTRLGTNIPHLDDLDSFKVVLDTGLLI